VKSFNYKLKTTNYKLIYRMSNETKNIKVGIIMGSDSDLPVMQQAADVLKEFEIEF